MVCDKEKRCVCVTKLCVKDGVCVKVVCERERVTKLCERWCDKAVCETWCGKRWCVRKLCAKDGVVEDGV